MTHVFGLPGSTEGPLLDALGAAGAPTYVLALHENAVVAMADGYARESGYLGVASLHTSVGTGNAVSQMINAYADGSPVLALIGHKDRRLANRDGFCTVEDLPGLLRPFTKWSREVTAAELAVEDLDRAARRALTSPRGPVALTLTEDRAAAIVPSLTGEGDRPPTPIGSALPGRHRPDDAEVAAMVAAMQEANRPVLVAGDGVPRSDGVELLAVLADRFACPIVQEPRRSAATMNVDTGHASYCGEYAASNPAVADADLVVVLGARFLVEFSAPRRSELPSTAQLIHLHEDPAELGKRYAADLAMVGAVGPTLRVALELTGGHKPSEAALARLLRLRQRHLEQRRERDAAADGSRLTVAAASRALNEAMPDDAVVIDEGVRSSRVLLQHLDLPPSRHYHRNTGGAIGWGLPAAVGASLAAPERRTFLLVGDGSALLSIQALWTAAHHELPITVVVSNNRGYQAVQAAVEMQHDEPLGAPAVGAAITDPAPDFVALAAGLGVRAEAAGSVAALRDALDRAAAEDGPYLVELQLAAEEHVGRR